ncbi:hypothetical protein HYV79_01495 [Candidatus Woesearchaeota archaeon]|nr:hypothetical protein [Candidatus Woesearchaeota archaeon]
MSKQLLLTLHEGVHKELKKLAEKKYMTLQEYIRYILREHALREKK